MPEDEFDRYLDLAVSNPDMLLNAIMGGMQRAQKRHEDKLNTIYVDAPQIEEKKEC